MGVGAAYGSGGGANSSDACWAGSGLGSCYSEYRSRYAYECIAMYSAW